MYSLVVSDSSKYKKAKYVNKNIVGEISHNEFKDVLLDKKMFKTFNK